MEPNKKGETKEYKGKLEIRDSSIGDCSLDMSCIVRNSKNRLLNFVVPVLSDLCFYDLIRRLPYWLRAPTVQYEQIQSKPEA